MEEEMKREIEHEKVGLYEFWAQQEYLYFAIRNIWMKLFSI